MARLPNGCIRMLCALLQFGSVVSAVKRPSPATARTRRSGPRTALSKRFSSLSSSTRSWPETITIGAPIISSQKIGPSSLASRARFCTGALESSDSMLPTTGLVGGCGIGLSLLVDAIARLSPALIEGSAEPLSTPFNQLGADLIRLFLLRPMATVPNQVLLEVWDDFLHAIGRRRRQHVIVFGHDHQRRHPHGVIDPGRALPVARHVAVPIDAAGEAGFGEGIDEHLLFPRRQDRRPRIVFRVVAGNHLWKCQIEPRRGANAGDHLLRRRGFAARHRLAHVGVKGLLDPVVY